MTTNFSEENFPLGIQCGHAFWNLLQLTEQYCKTPPPPRSYLLHLVSDQLRSTAGGALSPAELELWATLNEALRHIGRHYLQARGCRLTRNRLIAFDRQQDLPGSWELLQHFLGCFPARPVALAATSIAELLETQDRNGQLLEVLLELFLLRVQSTNPALKSARELFRQEEHQLQRECNYHAQLTQIDNWLPAVDDGYGHLPKSLLERLSAPLQQSETLGGQLQLLQRTWGNILPPELLTSISGAITRLEQEGHRPGPPGEPELTPIDPAAYLDEEYANFTVDLDWMPRTVLLAKSTYVWLHQLSAKYRRHIHRLDQIPDEELDELAASGFSSLWLIGIWQRSQASQKIKQLCGQVQVAASAYAIYDYRVADDLGGDEALENLRQRCRQRGIDLACDVVTNHTGLDSVWMQQHPEWFIQAAHPPYPGYRFTGSDLCDAPEITIQIEDGYFDHSEAAVVCRYQNHHSGEVRFIYHGNDGTHLPWNDTAQLNYLLPEVRETMIRLIIDVARRFRVIRFDAAMTLAKRHFQRLWFPLPGGGAGVPSRSDFAMANEEFNRVFPVEFWRELVDRIRDEAPDTLLIAEAFWLMEGYFVRTLGMHRVYNSAFMNMLKREENEKYRQTIKNILDFDPAILQRFVNFMSNPDEKPAIEQFGKEEKYFCVATMLATMPGLPMFGHGQLEGFHEKYGMEYLEPRWQEEIDQQLLDAHRRRLFPLLRKRALFSGSDHFQLYDFQSAYGVEENVFAYSNRLADRCTLVLCNNSQHRIQGRIGAAAAKAMGRNPHLPEALALNDSADFILLTDLSSGLQHLQPQMKLFAGGDFELAAYGHHVFSDFLPKQDHDGRWQQLWLRYGSSGRHDLDSDFAALQIEDYLRLTGQLLELPQPQAEPEKIAAICDQLQAELQQPHWQQRSYGEFMRLALHLAFPATNLAELELDRFANAFANCTQLTPQELFTPLDRLFNQRAWRKLLKCNYHNEVDWYNQEAFEQLLTIIFQLLIFHSHKSGDKDSAELQLAITNFIMNRQAISELSLKNHHKVDVFLQCLEGTEDLDSALPSAIGGATAMKILFVTPEATPFAKTGGLADVAGSLPRALRKLGHDVRVIMPCHRSAERGSISLKKGRKSVEVTLAGTPYRGSLKQASCDGTPFWFIDCPEFFDRESLYGTADGDYPDNSLRFGFFARAALEMIKRLDFRPDVIHVHDWQTCFIPAILRTELRQNPFYASIATLLTIHNLGYQGNFPMSVLQQLGLHDSVGTPKGMEYYGQLSALKGGISYADVINTVSPTYCNEIQQPEQGYGFDGLLRDRADDLHGIINGLDYHAWDPALDTALPTPYNIDNLNGKRACKRLLQKELGLELRHEVPIVALISRLDPQKGIELIEQAWGELLKRDLQFILLGSGDHKAMGFWRRQQGQNPERVSINLSFDEALSRRIFAASDMILVPSRYEPCGLTQMIGLKYGALPIVRKTGGLADTIIDANESPRQGYGFVFSDYQSAALLDAVDRALQLYPLRSRWLTLVKRGMAQDFSWENSAQQYIELYAKARSYRQLMTA